MAPGAATGKANRLIGEKSPYLLQHAHNPVDWYPWSAEAFARAKAEGKPVFLSVGYSTCHWCHVMERESFERQDVAELLNRHFIAIKVDREERPDLDAIYMHATQLMTGQGGWPNSVWLTPAGKPWFAGTYFPREDSFGRPGFKTVLKRLAEVWRTRRKDVEQQAEKLSEAVRQLSAGLAGGGAATVSRDAAAQAVAQLRGDFDEPFGGFGAAPKFPPHGALRLLLAEHRRTGDPGLLKMVTKTLDAMAGGGIRDHLGGGFHRYATDRRWRVPHFEKMLYDNAQLARIYAEACRAAGRQEYRRVAEEVLEWVLREMTGPAGGFHSALDADSDGEEGKFYLWRREEIVEVLGADDGELFCRAYGVQETGNFRDEATGRQAGTNILHLPRPLEACAKAEALPVADLRERLRVGRARLLARRDRRARPLRDDKVLTGWNGLMIGSFAYAGRQLGRPRYVEAAAKAARFVLANLRKDGRLLRTWRGGQARLAAYLDDYAFLADGLIELHQATGRKQWLDEAEALAAAMDTHYRDPNGGFFFTAADHEDLLVRSKSPFDQAIPSGNAVASHVLVRLGRLTGRKRYLHQAGACLAAFWGSVQRMPQGAVGMLLAAGEYLDNQEASRGPTGSNDGEDGPVRSEKPPITVEAIPSVRQAAPGGQVEVTVRVTASAGWHVNSAAPLQERLEGTSVGLAPAAAFRAGKVAYPPGKRITLGGEAVSVYEGTVEIKLPVGLAADAAPGRVRLALTVRTQPCNDVSCLAPQTHRLVVPIEIRPRPEK